LKWGEGYGGGPGGGGRGGGGVGGEKRGVHIYRWGVPGTDSKASISEDHHPKDGRRNVNVFKRSWDGGIRKGPGVEVMERVRGGVRVPGVTRRQSETTPHEGFVTKHSSRESLKGDGGEKGYSEKEGVKGKEEEEPFPGEGKRREVWGMVSEGGKRGAKRRKRNIKIEGKGQTTNPRQKSLGSDTGGQGEYGPGLIREWTKKEHTIRASSREKRKG